MPKVHKLPQMGFLGNMIFYKKGRQPKLRLITTIAHFLLPDFQKVRNYHKLINFQTVKKILQMAFAPFATFGMSGTAPENVINVILREALKKTVESVSMLIPRGGGPRASTHTSLGFFCMLQTYLVGSRKPQNKFCVHS